MTIRSAVIGDPISHSLSPTIHNFLLKKYGINGSYEAIRVGENELEKKLQWLIDEGFVGFNVTIPHKEKMFLLCDEKSESAKLTGAVNTVTIRASGKIFGDNSDVFGFLENLKKSQPKFDLHGKKVGVIGAGGAARAIVYGLISSGAKEIFITNRNEIRAQNLIEDFTHQKKTSLKFLPKNEFEKMLPELDLLVNASSLGMVGQNALDLNLENLQPKTVVYDIVYKPLITGLLSHAQKNKNPIITGIGMLVYQAMVGFESWFKIKPEIDDDLVKFLTKNS